MATTLDTGGSLPPAGGRAPPLTLLRKAGLVVLVAGAVAAVFRLRFGLGAATNLSDGYPWGLWISFDVLTGVALAAGGFTISAAVYVFNLRRLEPLLRPAKLSAFVGYLMVVLGLFFDLGQPWRIWHPMVMWNPHSVLFEVSWCVMLYTAVLAADLLIMLLEVLKRERAVSILKSAYVFLVVAGLILSTLHQSSLGALYLVLPQKMSDLWATKAVGPLFYASAVVAGLSVVALETLLSAKAHRLPVDMGLLGSLGKGLSTALLVYFAMKVTDLYARGTSIWRLDGPHLLFFVELFGTVALPAALLSFRAVRESRTGLMWSAGTAAFGVVLNRFNVSLTGYAGYRDFSYFPSVAELAVTGALVVLAVIAFDLGARYLPIYGRPLAAAGRAGPARG
jgi:Ni/Fe-hydrogenase subunit HybB-like protein